MCYLRNTATVRTIERRFVASSYLSVIFSHNVMMWDANTTTVDDHVSIMPVGTQPFPCFLASVLLIANWVTTTFQREVGAS